MILRSFNSRMAFGYQSGGWEVHRVPLPPFIPSNNAELFLFFPLQNLHSSLEVSTTSLIGQWLCAIRKSSVNILTRISLTFASRLTHSWVPVCRYRLVWRRHSTSLRQGRFVSTLSVSAHCDWLLNRPNLVILVTNSCYCCRTRWGKKAQLHWYNQYYYILQKFSHSHMIMSHDWLTQLHTTLPPCRSQENQDNSSRKLSLKESKAPTQ